jgi:hypothetical protein
VLQRLGEQRRLHQRLPAAGGAVHGELGLLRWVLLRRCVPPVHVQGPQRPLHDGQRVLHPGVLPRVVPVGGSSAVKWSLDGLGMSGEAERLTAFPSTERDLPFTLGGVEGPTSATSSTAS